MVHLAVGSRATSLHMWQLVGSGAVSCLMVQRPTPRTGQQRSLWEEVHLLPPLLLPSMVSLFLRKDHGSSGSPGVASGSTGLPDV